MKSTQSTVVRRNKLYALLRVGKEKIRMEEDAYRFFLKRHGAREKGGKASATTMSLAQLSKAINAMRALGFETQATPIGEPIIGKITALWCALADAGVVRNRSDAAMRKWCNTHTNGASLEEAEMPYLCVCVESLKQWCKRSKVIIHG